MEEIKAVKAVKERETYKDIPLINRKFRVEKFEALQGNALFARSVRILPAMGLGFLMGIKESSNVVITDDELIEYQKKCLQYCFEMLPSEKTSVINEEGSFAVKDLERDAITVLQLVSAVIAFNFDDFFDESRWKELESSIPIMKQSTPKTSTNSSGLRS